MTATHTNIAVAEIPGFRPLLMDLHVPPGAGPWPVVFWVHGGGWQSGSRHWLPESIAPFGLHRRLVGRGYAVADVDYRLSAEARFPAQLDDVQAAIRWVRGHGAEFRLDPRRFAALGESAGGHLAALAGLRGQGPTAVQAVVPWYPPVDLRDVRPPQPGSAEALLLGGQPADLPDRAAAASPITFVHPDAPPFLLLHGTDDSVVPLSQSERLAAALSGLGVRCDLIAVPGAEHCFVGAEDIGALIDTCIDFLDEVLTGAP